MDKRLAFGFRGARDDANVLNWDASDVRWVGSSSTTSGGVHRKDELKKHHIAVQVKKTDRYPQ